MTIGRRSSSPAVSLGSAVFLLCGTVGAIGFGAASAQPQDPKFSLSTTSFQAGADIPARFTCNAENLSPALAWTDPPAGTQAFALLVDDPDAPGGVFNHWVLFDLPASAHELNEGVPKNGDPEGARQGHNGFDELGYGGPCPPPGHVHRYYFRLYALDQKLNLPAGASKSAVEKAMKGHVLAQAEVMGRFKR